ncbi:hypothetical protein QFZ60_001835 [Arthrobacter sp. B2I5]|uniref:hypothetical protein n=1 Tax=Arthrobacter sp. B2I5 TaxID=3042266 RepID=UPI002788FAC8|nr:hypothetical protein [Arthrobacter sp. B2I5]MDQ0825662.1 hypothetical protein [Arthrobacter sp. B2I5]
MATGHCFTAAPGGRLRNYAPVRYKAAVPAVRGLMAVALAGATALPAAAEEGPPGGYPSWAEVQQAQSSEAAKAAEITAINGLLSGLQEQSEAAGDAAVRAAADHAAANAELQVAASKLETVSAQAARADDQLARYRKDIGALAVQSYKTGGTNTDSSWRSMPWGPTARKGSTWSRFQGIRLLRW